ncbi:MAG: DUF4250 domain-containing protein [Bacilli bacterium]|nr:DUF4250 domain-containing protein [Bacilli bacterium]
MMIPKIPSLLLCIVNTKLRDCYSSLDELCEDLSEDKEEIISILEDNGYYYNIELNQFIYKN